MIFRSLVDELSEDKDQDEKIIKTFYSKDTLSQDIFHGTKMIESIRNKLLSIADKFIDFLGVDFFVHDVVLTGSLANYNWSEFSDIDLHIIIDYEESGHNQGLLKEFFDAKKLAWNSVHDIKIKNYEVELYVQDIKEKHISSGVYSILNNKWIIEPQKAKQKIDDRGILEKGEEYAKIIDKLSEKKEKGEDVASGIDDIKKKLTRFRQSGLDKGGEYSYENLTFKLLRRNGYIGKLFDLKKDASNKNLSINESVQFNDRDILRVEKAAIKFYGTTDSFGRAGYITPSGYLLDFSEGQGRRVQDHRNIGYVLETLPNLDLGEYGGDKWKHSTSWGMYAVLDMGFIRYLPESHIVHITQMPSQEQFEKLHELIQQQNGKINVQLDNNYVKYEPDTPDEYIIGGIKTYFREGTIPKIYSDVEDEEMFLDRDIDEDVMSRAREQMFDIPDEDEKMNKEAARYIKTNDETPVAYINCNCSFCRKQSNPNVATDIGKQWPIFKNPKSLNNFDRFARGIANANGDLFVAQHNGDFNHGEMAEAIGINDIYRKKPEYVLLVRINRTNIFGLSDSTAEFINSQYFAAYRDVNRDNNNSDIIVDILHKTKNKNPQYKFYCEYYDNYENDPQNDEKYFINEQTISKDNISILPEDLNEILNGYIEAALWTEEERLNNEAKEMNGINDNDYDDESDESEDEIRFMRIMKDNYGNKPIESFSRENIEPDSLIKAYTDIKKFIGLAGDSVIQAIEENGYSRLGMDIWLTRNGHGAGFFDHSYDYENEQKLMSAGKSLGAVYLYINDHMKLSFNNDHAQ